MYLKTPVQLISLCIGFSLLMVSGTAVAFPKSVHSLQGGIDKIFEPIQEYLKRIQYDYHSEFRGPARQFVVSRYGSCGTDLFELRVQQVEINDEVRENLSFNHCTVEIDTIQMRRVGVGVGSLRPNDLFYLKGIELKGLDSLKLEFPWNNLVVNYKRDVTSGDRRLSIHTDFSGSSYQIDIVEEQIPQGILRRYILEISSQHQNSYRVFDMHIIKKNSGDFEFYISSEDGPVTESRFSQFYGYTIQQIFLMINFNFSSASHRWPAVEI